MSGTLTIPTLPTGRQVAIGRAKQEFGAAKIGIFLFCFYLIENKLKAVLTMTKKKGSRLSPRSLFFS